MKKTKLLFTEGARSFVLDALGFSTDSDGFITKDGARVIATDGKEIKETELGGISKQGVYRDDLYSIMQLAG